MSIKEDRETMATRFLTAFAGLAGGVLVTYVTAVASHSEEIARITERMTALESAINSSMDDRYRGSDAARDIALINEKIRTNAEHIAELEVLLRAEIERHNREHRGTQ
jgi:hypothetical protein